MIVKKHIWELKNGYIISILIYLSGCFMGSVGYGDNNDLLYGIISLILLVIGYLTLKIEYEVNW